MTTRTTAPWAAAGALLLGGLSACGHDAASARDDFCTSWAGQVRTLAGLDVDGRAAVRSLKDWAAEAREAGPPEGMPADARRGFERTLDRIEALDADATAEEVEGIGKGLGRKARREVRAFADYAADACPEALERMVDDLPDRMRDRLGELEGTFPDLQLGELTDLGDRLPQLPGS